MLEYASSQANYSFAKSALGLERSPLIRIISLSYYIRRQGRSPQSVSENELLTLGLYGKVRRISPKEVIKIVEQVLTAERLPNAATLEGLEGIAKFAGKYFPPSLNRKLLETV